MDAPVALIVGFHEPAAHSIAGRMDAEGWNTVVTGLRVPAQTQLFTDSKSVYLQGDIASASGRDGLISRVWDRFARIDAVVISPLESPWGHGHVLHTSESMLRGIVSGSLVDPYLFAQRAAQQMLFRNPPRPGPAGAIVTVAHPQTIAESPLEANTLNGQLIGLTARLMQASLAGSGILCPLVEGVDDGVWAHRTADRIMSALHELTEARVPGAHALAPRP